MIKRLYYGWFDERAKLFRVSAYPPDAPVRPSLAFETKADLMAVIDRKRARIMWWPPLPGWAADAPL